MTRPTAYSKVPRRSHSPPPPQDPSCLVYVGAIGGVLGLASFLILVLIFLGVHFPHVGPDDPVSAPLNTTTELNSTDSSGDSSTGTGTAVAGPDESSTGDVAPPDVPPSLSPPPGDGGSGDPTATGMA